MQALLVLGLASLLLPGSAHAFQAGAVAPHLRRAPASAAHCAFRRAFLSPAASLQGEQGDAAIERPLRKESVGILMSKTTAGSVRVLRTGVVGLAATVSESGTIPGRQRAQTPLRF
jgi:hypothetical protein